MSKRPPPRKPIEQLVTVCPDLYSFYLANHRLPHLGDPQQPWTFRGWSLPYLFEVERLLAGGQGRWDYYFRTLTAERLLAEPIPDLHFDDVPNRAVMTSIERWMRTIEVRHSSWDSFRDLVEWLAWALGITTNPSKLDDEIQERLYRDVNLGPLLQYPHDYLGTFLAERRGNGAWNPLGFYPTPHAIAHLMALITLQDALPADGRDPRTAPILDCAVGTGRLLLAASGKSLVLCGNDVDPLVLMICKINGALYAPWLSFPLPTSITEPVTPTSPTLPIPTSSRRPQNPPTKKRPTP